MKTVQRKESPQVSMPFVAADTDNMKRSVDFLVVVAVGLVLMTGCSGRKVWDQPETLYSNATLTVTGVERLQDRTVFHLTAQGQKGSNFRIQPSTYLVGDDGRKYALQGSEGQIGRAHV